MKEKTFAMIKPDAVKNGNTGLIIDLIERNGFCICNMRKEQLSEAQVRDFYAIHSHQPWFSEVIDYITSGPVVLMALEKENAIADWRGLMGATDPAKASMGTLRKMFGKSIGTNATHGSDAPETAKTELAFFFSGC